jgi:hypothetical protein
MNSRTRYRLITAIAMEFTEIGHLSKYKGNSTDKTKVEWCIFDSRASRLSL